MGRSEQLKKTLLTKGCIGFYAYCIYRWITRFPYNMLSDKQQIRKYYRKVFGKYPDLDSPQTLNEKIQWLKLYGFQDFHTFCCDKYLMRDYVVEKIGEEAKEHLIPLLFETSDWRDITIDNLPNEPFVLKPTHTSGDYKIIRNKREIDINLLQGLSRYWLHRNFYRDSREKQYKNSPRRLIAEKMLISSDGYIPNDYKLHYINGELQFVYCSVARETENYRKIYSPEWKPLPFIWVPKSKLETQSGGDDIPMPASFLLMKKYADIIAKDFDYVRVDFYDVDGKLFFGEITLFHGSGYDVFSPQEYDLLYGKKLRLTIKNKGK